MKKLKLSKSYTSKIRDILVSEGFLPEQIEIMLDSYSLYDDKDREKIVNNDKDDIHLFLEKIPARIEEQKKYICNKPTLKKQIENVCDILKRSKVSLSQAKCLTTYSGHENVDILELKRMNNYNALFLKRITKDLLYELMIDSHSQNFNLLSSNPKFKNAVSFIKSLDYSNPNSDKKLTEYLKQNNLYRLYRHSFNVFYEKLKMFYKYRDDVRKIDKALQNSIPYNTIVYRGVLTFGDINTIGCSSEYKDLVGARYEEKGYLSTSLTFLSSFAKSFSEVCLKIFVPKGSEGMDIIPFSKNRQECEILLNSCDLYVLDYYSNKTGIFDGEKTDILEKPTLVLFLLSKNRECYKDIAKKNSCNEIDISSSND